MKRQGRRGRRSLFFRRAAILLTGAAIVIAAGWGGMRALRLAEPVLSSLPQPLSALSFAQGSSLTPAAADSETVQQLRELAGEEPRLQEIADNSGEYPEKLLRMLVKNMDMLDFVLGYPEHRGEADEDAVVETGTGGVPLLLQYDPRWGYGRYGDSILAVNGCGPTCLSMVSAALTGDGTATPYRIAQYADSHGYYAVGAGTSWSLMTEGCASFGLCGEELPLSESGMQRALEEGRLIICSMGPGDFTTSGHFIVLTGYGDGGFSVHDPNSRERSAQTWDYERLAPQIRNLWAFSAA